MNISHNNFPAGYNFKPTVAELIEHYLKNKVACRRMDVDLLEVDLNEVEPWNIPELCKINGYRQIEWYFFGRKEKFSVRNHTNRATKGGYWKAGIDRPLCYKADPNSFIAMEKTLCFFQGKEPNGILTEWVMYEYRLETNEAESNILQTQEESWVLYKMVKKSTLPARQLCENQFMKLIYGSTGLPGPAAAVEESNQRIGQY